MSSLPFFKFCGRKKKTELRELRIARCKIRTQKEKHQNCKMSILDSKKKKNTEF